MFAPNHPDVTLERIVREDWGRILSILIKDLGDFALAEDCLQEAAASALKHWEKQGLPKSPMAWLIKTARRKAIDRFRRTQTARKFEAEISYLTDLDNQDPQDMDIQNIPDKRLELMFTCCHPSLENKTQLALTLKTIGGLTVDEIASAFLDKPATMAARLTRAKKKISAAGIPYEIPSKEKLPERLEAVLAVIYLIFNEGYASSSGQALNRVDLSDEAIRLARIMTTLLPNQGEVEGLLALMLLHDARRPARTGMKGQYIPLEHHDRTKWHKGRIKDGQRLLQAAMNRGQIGPYQIQASISALHCEAANWEETDWAQIVLLYQELYKFMPTKVVIINHAVALSYAQSPEAGLKMLERLGDMPDYVPYLLAKADFSIRAGKVHDATFFFMQALALTQNQVERDYISEKLATLGGQVH